MEENKGAAPSADAKDIEENKGITFLSYIGILCLIPLLTKKDSKFAQYHAKQGVVLFVCMIVSSFLVPAFGIGFLLYLACAVLAIMGLINVSKGEMKELPIIGQFGSKINI